MLAPSWVALIRQIPPTLHDCLVLITATGAEIMIQKILVLEQDYMVFRGRMSGVQDGGMVMVMPFDQISNLAFNKRMLEPEVRQIFSNSEFVASAPDKTDAEKDAAAAAQAPISPTQTREEMEHDAAQVVLATASTNDPSPTPAEPIAKPTQPSKSTLLARLRERLSGQSKT